MAKIIFTGKAGAESIELGSFMITIGRHADNNVIFSERHVAKEHAIVGFDGSHYFVEDMGSRLGTQINNVPISGRAVLKNQDRISIGANIIKFEDAPASGLKAVSIPATQQSTPTAGSAGAEMLGKLMNSIRDRRSTEQQKREEAVSALMAEWEKLLAIAIDLKNRVGGDERVKYFGIDRINNDVIIRIQRGAQSPQEMITAALQHPNSKSPMLQGIWLLRSNESDECFQTADEVSTEIIRDLALHLA